MAQLDSSIILQARQPQIESPVNNLAKIMQLQGLQQEGQMRGMQMQDAMDARTSKNKLAELYQSSVGVDGKLDRNKLIQGAAQRGLGAQIPALQKQFADADEQTGKVEAQAFKLANERYGAFKTTLGALSQRPDLSKELVMQAGQELVSAGIIPAQMYEQSIANMPDDPNALRTRLRDGLASQMSPEKIFEVFAPKAEKIDNGQTIGFRDINPNSPTYGQNTGGAPVQRQMTPGEVSSAATARRGQDITVRGQNMTDARTREFNATKVEENNIKRDEKKATQDLTKSSQVASFDTMLGTLDRLSKHPGLSRSVGVVGALPTMPGSNSANFQAELNTFQSQAFLPMVAQLKGMGALSDAEGKKLTAAVGALDPKMGEQAFRDSVQRITEDMQAARARMTGEKYDRPSATNRSSQGGFKILSVE